MVCCEGFAGNDALRHAVAAPASIGRIFIKGNVLMRKQLLPGMLYAAFAAMTLGIFLQQIMFSLFMLSVIFAALFSNLSSADVFLRSRATAVVFFALVVASALFAQVTRPQEDSVKFHWAFIAMWAISPVILHRINFRNLHRTMLLVSSFGLIYSCYWLLQPDELAWAMQVGFTHYPRAEGLVSNPITHAETMLILACWSLARLGYDPMAKLERRLIAYHLQLTALVIIFSRVRSGILVIVLLLLVYALLWPKLRRYALFALVTVVGLSLAAFLWFGFNLASIDERLVLIQRAVDMFQQHPILGIGPDRFDEFFTAADKVKGHPHNTLLGIAVETGMLGLAAYLALMFSLLWQLWQLRPQREEVRQKLAASLPEISASYDWIWLALTSTMVIFWVFGLFDYNFVDTELLIAHGLHWSLITAFYARIHSQGG